MGLKNWACSLWDARLGLYNVASMAKVVNPKVSCRLLLLFFANKRKELFILFFQTGSFIIEKYVKI